MICFLVKLKATNQIQISKQKVYNGCFAGLKKITYLRAINITIPVGASCLFFAQLDINTYNACKL